MKSNKSNGKTKKGSAQTKQQKHMAKAKQVLLPVPNAQYGTTAIAQSDLTPSLAKTLASFSTSRSQVVKARFAVAYGTIPSLSQSSVEVDQAYSVSLSQLAGATDYIGAFDEYRFDAMSFEITPRYNATSSTFGFPRLHTVLDYNDASALSISTLQGYGTYVMCPPGTGVVRAFQPACSMPVFTASTPTSSSPAFGQWIDTTSSTVNHYGLKLAIEAAPSGQVALQIYGIDVFVYVSFRFTR